MKDGRAIWAAYDDTGALAISCINCAAQQGQWCTRPDGRVRKVPCIERAAAGGILAADHNGPYRDFSEPTHPHQIERNEP
ncbi:hypothetical protein A5656_19940 [Mycobacterium gordonae]|jgi:hypothetical protein|uniref:hypothetical protein n=1 Tax=Mycobacterium paragordonae TaxID=1389713 RepID=UPI0007EF270F|nr:MULTISPECIES: hypothetical protein [Mycobacterium]OBK56183.1 hypothetical protein A5656_19940 [Mycobacterium gordonae]